MKLLQQLLYTLFFTASIVSNAKFIDVTDGTQVHRNLISSDVFVDTLNTVTIESIEDSFFKENNNVIVTENIHATYWYKIELYNPSSDKNDWFLEFDDPHISHLKLYKEDGKLLSKQGYYEKFGQRDVQHKNFVFSIKIEKKEKVVLYLQVKNRIYSYLGFRIRTPKQFSGYSLGEYFVLGLFYGVLLILFVYNLVMFFVLKDANHLYYVIYIAMGALYAFSEDGIGFHMLWSNYPWMNKFMIIFCPSLFLISFYLYANSFAGIWGRLKKLSRVIYSFLIVLVISSWAIHYFGGSHEMWWVAYLVPFSLIYFGVYQSYKDGEKSAKLFLAGSTVILFSMFVFVCRVFGLLDGNVFTVYIFNFGLIINAVVLSFAQAEKIRRTHEDKEEAQENLILQLEENDQLKDKVNRELEDKVSERTSELKKKTVLLETTIDELNNVKNELYKINSDLDVKNFRLRKEVESKTKLFIKGETLIFDDFKKLFPDALSCKIFLRDLKKSSTLTCKKCGHGEYIVNGKFDRKCAKCKYPESVTANTLFHKVKFPLEKAFYITYITVYSKQKYTLDQLSEDIDLRKNTCWSFKKKVEEKVDLLQDSGIKDVSFAEIIL